jgi:hypothetical protein
MSFDPKGTTPGLMTESKPQPTIHHMRCRNENCTSIQATEIVMGSTPEGAGASHNRLYQCVKCRHTWTLGVGGSVNL